MALSPATAAPWPRESADPRAGTQDLWLVDLTKDRAVPMTATRGFSGNPVWSADGRRLAYAYEPPGQFDRRVHQGYRHRGDPARHRDTYHYEQHPVAWSHDGRSLLVFAWR